MIINAALGYWYPKGQQRLLESLRDVNCPDNIATFLSYPKPGYNEQNPYTVKASCFEWAQAEKTIIWLDCSIWAINKIEPLIDHIKTHGHYFYKSGYNCAQSCNDYSLKYFGVSRDMAEDMPELASNLMALDMSFPKSQAFVIEFIRAAKAGVFDGSRDHAGQSEDPRFLFHRQDQSAASLIANKLGMEISEPNHFLVYEGLAEPNKNTIFKLQGM